MKFNRNAKPGGTGKLDARAAREAIESPGHVERLLRMAEKATPSSRIHVSKPTPPNELLKPVQKEMNMFIGVFHNQNPLAMFRGLEAGDRLILVYGQKMTLEQQLVESKALKQAFGWFNHGSGTTKSDYTVRSLSVGDVITFQDGEWRKSYAVTKSGWTQLDDPFVVAGAYAPKLRISLPANNAGTPSLGQ